MSPLPPSPDQPAEPPEGPAGPPSGPLSGPASEPPSSGNRPAGPGHTSLTPAGPPSGPTSGPGAHPGGPGGPPSGPRTVVTGGGGGGDGGGGKAGGGGHRKPPWWRNPRTVLPAGIAAVVLGVVLGLVLSGGSGTPAAAQQVALQPAGSAGQDPFTGSVTDQSAAPTTGTATAAAPGGGNRSGGDAGLYGGTMNVSSCDVPKLSAFLAANPDKAKAWAGVEGIQPNEIDGYLKGLTPVVLRVDTRVTNHGFSNGQATAYQAVLQTGTAVLIDSHGVPRVRCACGNPLTPPVDPGAPASYNGQPWAGFNGQQVVIVTPAPQPIQTVVLVDTTSGKPFARPTGGTGQGDSTHVPTQPPSSSSGSPSTSGSSGSPSSGTPSTSTPSSGTPSSGPSGSESGSPSAPSSAPSSAPKSGGGQSSAGGAGASSESAAGVSSAPASPPS
ncbi:DUF6777 domain-containing protein [Kitasatospora sp. NPDC085879]|uniref:DUF6777 domain-containing protein n=1 Tax=Kitasatospora sp. NPDC085879 TaxID=3154769 RepID=UPI003415D3B1